MAAMLRAIACAMLAAVAMACFDLLGALLSDATPMAAGVADWIRFAMVAAGSLVVPITAFGFFVGLTMEVLWPEGSRQVWFRLALAFIGVAALSQTINVMAYVRLYTRYHQLLTGVTSGALFLAAWLGFPSTKAPATGVRPMLATTVFLALVAGQLTYSAHDLLAGSHSLRSLVFAANTSASHGVAYWSGMVDRDKDGWSGYGGVDCDDRNPAVHPGARDVAGDGIDSDCLAGDVRRDELPAPPQVQELIPPSKPQNLLVVTVDALRAEALDGRWPGLMPQLEALAASGALFTRAYSVASWTAPATYALWTGRYPSRVRWTRVSLEGGQVFRPLSQEGPRWAGNTYLLPLSDRSPTLASCMGAAGYRTAAISSVPFMLPGTGILRGFEEVAKDIYLRHNLRLAGKVDSMVASTALNWLKALPEGEPFLMWLHLSDPHAPYHGEGASPLERYRSELRGSDAALGQLMAGLKALGLAEQTWVVLTGDHGEEFGEHGGAYHGASLYEEIVRVPLVIAGPKVHAGARFVRPVSLTDLSVTAADLLSLPCLMMRRLSDGQSLAKWVTDEQVSAVAPYRPLFAELHRDGDQVALIHGSKKVIRNHRAATMLGYDLAVDPGEQAPSTVIDDALVRLLSAHSAGALP